MNARINPDLVRIAGMTCCSGPSTFQPKTRRLPGTISGKAGVRQLAGTVCAANTPEIKD